ncbi:hypothetical protein AYO44_13235 [Planctomycetaceae bacterium SCGC AG-212-F19]|nr:hypothetical protein AYO44_13235 [Planctomycetaceae bacterium SCGC AG-212-F19]
MLSLWSQPFRLPGNKMARRELLRAGTLGLSALLTPGLLGNRPAAAASDRSDRARGPLGKGKSCIFIFNFGGPSQLETWDLKPSAPDGIRGEFKPIATSVPGTQIGEGLPHLAKLTHKFAIIRSMAHQDIEHQSGGYTGLTGHRHPNPRVFAAPTPDDAPPYGAVLSKLRPATRAVPSFVSMPTTLVDAVVIPGQTAGWLGKAHDPLHLRKDPNDPAFSVQELTLIDGVSPERFADRCRLLEKVAEAGQAPQVPERLHGFDAYYQKAFRLLSSDAAQSAFRIQSEPDNIRERYGRTTFGQCCLLARRLVEAGVPVVSVYFCSGGLTGLQASRPWDTHEGNFTRLKQELLPVTDQAMSALLEDLSERGLLDQTVVASIGEFGRSPRIGGRSSPNGSKPDGRDHWPYCYSALLAGGGIAGGRVHGASDRIAGHPVDSPVSPADFAATIYHSLGIDPTTEILDRVNRPLRICEGNPVMGLL